MQLDTGADVNVMSMDTWRALNLKKPINKCKTKLKAYGNKSISIYGKVFVQLKRKNK